MKLQAIVFALTMGLCACGGDDPAGTVAMGISTPAQCKPAEVRPCPCLGGGTGMQTCSATGSALSACMGCMNGALAAGTGGAKATAGNASPGGATFAPSTGGTGGTLAAGRGGPGGASAGTGGGAGAGTGGAGPSAGKGGAAMTGSGGATSGSKPLELPATKGVTCGVGLPTQCADGEKCCKRSLETDTCEPMATMCECEGEGCVSIDVRCDGPEDCASGEQCCATDTSSGSSGGSTPSRPRPGGGFGARITGFSCAASCSSPSRQACHAKADCSGSLTCAISQQIASISICTDPASLEQ